MGDLERIRSTLENIQDLEPTRSCFDPGQSNGIRYFHQIPDPKRIPLDPFLTTLWRCATGPPQSRYATQPEGFFTSRLFLLLLCQCTGSEFTQHNLTENDPNSPCPSESMRPIPDPNWIPFDQALTNQGPMRIHLFASGSGTTPTHPVCLSPCNRSQIPPGSPLTTL